MASTGISSSLPGAPWGPPVAVGKGHQSSEVTEIDGLKWLKWLIIMEYHYGMLISFLIMEYYSMIPNGILIVNCEKKRIAHHESHMPPSSIQVTQDSRWVALLAPIFPWAFVHQPLGLKFFMGMILGCRSTFVSPVWFTFPSKVRDGDPLKRYSRSLVDGQKAVSICPFFSSPFTSETHVDRSKPMDFPLIFHIWEGEDEHP